MEDKSNENHPDCTFELSDGTIMYSCPIAQDINVIDDAGCPGVVQGTAKRAGPARFVFDDILKIERGVSDTKLSYRIMANRVPMCQVNGADVDVSVFDRVCAMLALNGVKL